MRKDVSAGQRSPTSLRWLQHHDSRFSANVDHVCLSRVALHPGVGASVPFRCIGSLRVYQRVFMCIVGRLKVLLQ